MPAFAAGADDFATTFAAGLLTAFAADDFIADDFAADDFAADDFATMGFATDGLAFATGFDFATGFLGADFAAEVFDEALAMASSHCEREIGCGLHHGCRHAQAGPCLNYHQQFQIITKDGKIRGFAAIFVTI